MPWFPTHNITCGERLCRPGEGNLAGYKFWGQPYLHREEFVQAQSRRPPHQPEPWHASYAALVHVARRVEQQNLVLLTAADWDYREIVLNWVLHAHRLGYRNAVVLAMECAGLRLQPLTSRGPPALLRGPPPALLLTRPGPASAQPRARCRAAAAQRAERRQRGQPGRVERDVPAAPHRAGAARAHSGGRRAGRRGARRAAHRRDRRLRARCRAAPARAAGRARAPRDAPSRRGSPSPP